MGFFTRGQCGRKESSGNTLPRCGLCGLRRQCKSPQMPVTGRGKRRVLFVGEAPGREEDERGVQLIGKAGKLLRRILRDIGVDLDDCWKTNAVCCRPPKNQIEDKYIESCRPILNRTIAELQPSVIIPLGLSAVKSIIASDWTRDVGTARRWMGWQIPLHTHGAWVCPTYHPSYVARMNEDMTLIRIVRDHLKTALRLEGVPLRGTPLVGLRDQVAIVTDKDEARRRMLDLVHREGVLAFDYETTGLKPDRPGHRIVSCSFCLDGSDTFACPIGNDRSLLEALSAVLQNTRLRKVASNLKFEERWSIGVVGTRVVNWYWDTMLASHVLDNRPEITSLKFQAFALLGVGDYESAVKMYLEAKGSNDFNRIDEIPLRDLLLYNGLDSLLEYNVMRVQRRAMK